ncbi:MAG: KamA family radical SAM protein [Candidatus Lightella neohaematopini]|nr:KamA family radical SAM protein [Candidatus Lightella neohaematopini]MCV2531403.1 KamA family radical SAM protein [Candidatus Lightella neohaematopini]
MRYFNSKEIWLNQLVDTINSPYELLSLLKLDSNVKLVNSIKTKVSFSFRVPKIFVERMKLNDPNDPLLMQVLINSKESRIFNKLAKNISFEKHAIKFNLIHKYNNRVLILLNNSCAIHCRYCFRRDYLNNISNIKNNMNHIINYILSNKEINEVILSGGDPLIMQDKNIKTLILMLEKINHILILRIHTRLPIIIPSRITDNLCNILINSRFRIILVTHINHANEINSNVINSMNKLRQANVILLNQSVLLRNINNNANVLANLSIKLIQSGIIPYYIHLLDKINSNIHFLVTKVQANRIMKDLSNKVSGYLLPKLMYNK